jgi:hypothetical protein
VLRLGQPAGELDSNCRAGQVVVEIDAQKHLVVDLAILRLCIGLHVISAGVRNASDPAMATR